MNKTIYLIRHGQTLGNIEKRYIGITDEPLTESAKFELRQLLYPRVDMVFCSPMKRAIDTARIIYPKQTPIVINDIRETDFGEFEGKNYQDLEDDPKYEEWLETAGHGAFPGGESPVVVTIRAMSGFNRILALSSEDSNIAIVTHGGIIMSILQELFGGDYYNYHVENGKGYSFEISSDGVCSGLCNRLYDR